MRVAVVLPSHWSRLTGGAEQQVRYLLEALVGDPDLRVRYFAGNVDPHFRSSSYEVVPLSAGSTPGRRSRLLQSRRLYEELALFAPHVIYQRVGCVFTGIAARYAHAHGARLVWHVASDADLAAPGAPKLRAPLAALERRFLDFGIARAHCIVAQSRAQLEALIQRHHRDDAILLRNFHPAPATVGPKQRRFTVAWVANCKPLKRPEVVFELARRLRRLDCRFVMVGRFPNDPAVRRQLQNAISATSNLEHLGPLSQEEVNELLGRSHMLLNTSLYEGFPNTFIQAWMRAVPVATLGVDPEGMIARHGLGVVTADVDELARTVERFILDPEECAAAGERARTVAAREFSLVNATRLVDLIRRQGRLSVADGHADVGLRALK